MSGQGPGRTASGQRASIGATPSGPATTARSRSSTVPSGSLGSVPGRRGWRDLDARLLGVVGRLTERDRLLCRLLDDHRVLTTAQVAEVGFSGERRARMRLSELYALDILDLFRPKAWGRPSPFHWVLGPLGAAFVAVEAGLDVADLSWRRSLVHELAASQRLAHLVGLNGFFYCLFGSARTRPAVGSMSGGRNGAVPGSGVRSSAPTATASGAKLTSSLVFEECGSRAQLASGRVASSVTACRRVVANAEIGPPPLDNSDFRALVRMPTSLTSGFVFASRGHPQVYRVNFSVGYQNCVMHATQGWRTATPVTRCGFR